jgi:hypothetical protein
MSQDRTPLRSWISGDKKWFVIVINFLHLIGLSSVISHIDYISITHLYIWNFLIKISCIIHPKFIILKKNGNL